MKTLLSFTVWQRSDRPAPNGRGECASSASGFTRWELVVVVAMVGLLTCLVMPGLANVGQGSEQAWCANNLRLMGRGFTVWAKDHNYVLPWRVPVSDGGTQRAVMGGSAWFQFAWVSNELVMPKILACPSDAGTRKMASNWSSAAEGGFLHQSYRANALSYWIGLDAGVVQGLSSIELTPDHAVSGDRNLRFNGMSAACSSGVNNAAQVVVRPLSALTVRWTNSIHGLSGNLLLNDGRVLTTSTAGLRQALSRGDDNGAVHILPPK